MSNNLTPERIKEIAIATRLHEISQKVEALLGDEFKAVCREYYPAIRQFMRDLKCNPVAVASLIGKQISEDGKNPLPFMAACVQFTKDHPEITHLS